MKIADMRHKYDSDFPDNDAGSQEYDEFCSDVMFSLPALMLLAEYARDALAVDTTISKKMKAMLERLIVDLF